MLLQMRFMFLLVYFHSSPKAPIHFQEKGKKKIMGSVTETILGVFPLWIQPENFTLASFKCVTQSLRRVSKGKYALKLKTMPAVCINFQVLKSKVRRRKLMALIFKNWHGLNNIYSLGMEIKTILTCRLTQQKWSSSRNQIMTNFGQVVRDKVNLHTVGGNLN